jgi:hypothetical protein
MCLIKHIAPHRYMDGFSGLKYGFGYQFNYLILAVVCTR